MILQRKSLLRTLLAALTLSTPAIAVQAPRPASPTPRVLGSEAAAPAAEAPAPDAQAARRASLLEQNTLSGSTGLLRLLEPTSGAAGTFRLGLLADWFSGSSFLCTAGAPCGTNTRDKASHFGSVLGLSVTPLPYLEAYASLHSFSNSDDAHSPGLIDVLGNTTLGAKLFTAGPSASLFSVGGSAELELLDGAGSVGIDGKSTSFRLTALGGADLRRLASPLPLRVTTNLGYFVDNSGSLIQGVEQASGARITRVERFGLDINRVDRVQTGLGVEGLFSLARPFLEWNLELPVNRQNYTCQVAKSYSGDHCLHNDGKLSAFPSTLTLGARFFPALKGLSGTVAFDLGTSGTSNFLEELAPTLPWDLWLGVGYAFDAVEPPPPKVVVAERVPEPPPSPKPSRRVRGFVHEKGKEEGIPNAIVHYQGREITAMASGSDGRFLSQDLEPGSYTFSVEAPAFKPGECNVVVEEEAALPAPAASAMAQPPPSVPPAGGPTPVGPGPQGAPQIRYFLTDCELEALPRVGTVAGRALDAEGGSPVADAVVELTDPLGRSLRLTTDAAGRFRFDQVLPGAVMLKAQSPVYLLHAQTLTVQAREEAHADIELRKRPRVSLIDVTPTEIKLKQPIHFAHDAAEILADSNALLDEVADALARKRGILRVEIQGHTDDGGPAEHNQSLSEARASAVLDWLTSHGIEKNRLVARGYGSEKPISPNVTPQGRARNRRVQFIISEQESKP